MYCRYCTVRASCFVSGNHIHRNCKPCFSLVSYYIYDIHHAICLKQLQNNANVMICGCLKDQEIMLNYLLYYREARWGVLRFNNITHRSVCLPVNDKLPTASRYYVHFVETCWFFLNVIVGLYYYFVVFIPCFMLRY